MNLFICYVGCAALNSILKTILSLNPKAVTEKKSLIRRISQTTYILQFLLVLVICDVGCAELNSIFETT